MAAEAALSAGGGYCVADTGTLAEVLGRGYGERKVFASGRERHVVELGVLREIGDWNLCAIAGKAAIARSAHVRCSSLMRFVLVLV